METAAVETQDDVDSNIRDAAEMETQEGGDGGSGETGRQLKRCGTIEMAFLGKSRETV